MPPYGDYSAAAGIYWGISANYCFVCIYIVTNSAKLGMHNMLMDSIVPSLTKMFRQ